MQHLFNTFRENGMTPTLKDALAAGCIGYGNKDEHWSWNGPWIVGGVRVARYVWELHKGPILKGEAIIRQCEVPTCVNPDHMKKSTYSEAIKQSRGEKVDRRSPLTKKDILEIRRLSKTPFCPVHGLAEMYGVSSGTIRNLLKGHTWAWVREDDENA